MNEYQYTDKEQQSIQYKLQSNLVLKLKVCDNTLIKVMKRRLLNKYQSVGNLFSSQLCHNHNFHKYIVP